VHLVYTVEDSFAVVLGVNEGREPGAELGIDPLHLSLCLFEGDHGERVARVWKSSMTI